jgi:hypothetical protein
MSEIRGEASITASPDVVRGRPFWAIIYAALGFLLAVEGNLVQMLGAAFPCSVIIYLAVMAGTVWLFTRPWFQEWFHPRLKKYLDRIENQPR